MLGGAYPAMGLDPMRIVLIGEAMLELSQADDGWRLGHGGDTVNMAIHLARSGHNVAYLTALGSDPFSDDLRNSWRDEGIDTSLVLTDPTKYPGLYAIRTNDAGERSFFYWRENSAARGLFTAQGIGAALKEAEGADLLAYSLISLAILPPEARQALFALCARVRARGGKVAFDGNYRPRLWPDVATAIDARDQAIACADIGLPTLDDETLLSGETTADAVAAHWQRCGADEVIVKLGAQGCHLPDGTVLPPPERLSPVDTSGAGDAFNAGYLGERLMGEPPNTAALTGHLLAGWTIMRRGAIPALDKVGT
jgi:2-dehydro-3-deoxygluconokinase